MQEVLTLTKAGVPWDVVMDMDDTTRRGFCIAAGWAEGHEFDWNGRMWKKPNG